MVKRQRVSVEDDLTGGTGDINPQFMNVFAIQTGVDAAETVEYTLPKPVVGTSKTHATIIEVLKVFFQVSTLSIRKQNNASDLSIFLGTKDPGVSPYARDSSCFAYYQMDMREVWVAGAGESIDAVAYKEEPHIFDCTDGSGHGILIASDTIFCTVDSSNTNLMNSGSAKILYRYKTVGLLEYVGIAQGQSS